MTIQMERDRLQDQTAGVITRDDIIEQARLSRDDAISRLVTVTMSCLLIVAIHILAYW